MKNFIKTYLYFMLCNYLIIALLLIVKHDFVAAIIITIYVLKYLILIWVLFGFFWFILKFYLHFEFSFYWVFSVVHIGLYCYAEFGFGNDKSEEGNFILLVPSFIYAVYRIILFFKLDKIAKKWLIGDDDPIGNIDDQSNDDLTDKNE